MNSVKIAAALRLLAEAFESAPPVDNDHVAPGCEKFTAPAPTPVAPKPRGRPPKVEAAPVAAAVADDPFASTPPTPPVPTATLDEVRAALTALRSASTQDIAVAVLKAASGAGDLTALTADKYGAVVAAATAKLLEYSKPAAPVDADPFASPAAVDAKAVTLEDVQKAVVNAQKRTAADTVQRIVMDHGGKGPHPQGLGEAPSLKALPADQYAAVVKQLDALPTTKTG